MKKLLFVPLVFLCASAALADPAAEVRQAISALYAKADAAALVADWTVYGRISTPNCRFLSPGHAPLTVDQITKGLPQMMVHSRISKARTEIETLTLNGDRAVASSIQTSDGVFNGKPLHDVTRNKDTWRKTPSGWRLTLSQVVSDKMTPGALPPIRRRPSP